MFHVLRRALSTSAKVSQTVQIPTQVYGVAGKYAAALYTSAYKSKALENVAKDLGEVKNLYATHKDFKLFVENPTLNRQKKKIAVEAVMKNVASSAEVVNFCGTLAENGRLNFLPQVIECFEEIMRAHRGELFVEVTSAETLSQKHKDALSDALQKFSSGKKLHVNYTIKPSIIGGLVVTIGDKYVDLSLASRLQKLNTSLQTAI